MRAIVIQGLALGDEAKGAAVDKICRSAPVGVVVRFCGGCQAGHAVVTEDGREHIFSQFGAGMLANDHVKTHLSRFMLVEPLSMMREADALGEKTSNVWERITVDAQCVVTTPLHKQLNRLREEARGAKKHGSCGRGIGVTRELQLLFGDRVLLAGDFNSPKILREKIDFIWDVLKAEITQLSDRLGKSYTEWIGPAEVMHAYQSVSWPVQIVDGLEPSECMVFEGAQGVMLDEKHGTAPYNTWTNTTFENADTLLDEIGCKDRLRIGCLRSYYTRHGAGPFPTEDNSLDLPEPHNGNDGFQGQFRVGRFDYQMADKALSIVKGVDCLAISHLDYLPRLGIKEEDFLRHVEYGLETPIGMLGRGPTAAHRTVNLEVPA